MNKLITTLVTASLVLSAAAPVMAKESTSTAKAIRQEINEERKEIRKELNDERKDVREELKNKTKDIRDELKDKKKDGREEFKKKQSELLHRLVKRQLTMRGELTAVSGVVVPATLTIKVSGVWPDLHKQWETVSSSTYPSKDKLITVKVSDKTRLLRRFWGKSSLGEMVVGDAMHVVGRLNEDGSILASVVKDDSIHTTHKVQHGAITSIDATAQKFVMQSAASSSPAFTVHVGSAAKIKIPGMATSTFANLKVGDKVFVRGVVNNRAKFIEAGVVKVKLPEPVPAPAVAPPTAPAPTSTATST